MAKLNVVLAGGVFVAALALGLIVTTPIAVAAQGTKSAAPAAKMDLNAASQAELEKLPGVGEATAKKIIAGRQVRTDSTHADRPQRDPRPRGLRPQPEVPTEWEPEPDVGPVRTPRPGSG